MAKAILSPNEEQSLAILRMLNNGGYAQGNHAFDIINEYLKDPLRSVLLLETVLPLEAWKAKEVLCDFLPAAAADKVILLLFDKPPHAYFIVDYSMIPKITAISYLGNWNFSKVYIAQNFKNKEKDQILSHLEKLGKDSTEMQRLYQEAFLISEKDLNSWISRPVQFYGPAAKGQAQGDIVYFENGFMYNKKEKIVYTNTGQIPRSLFYQDTDKLQEVAFNNANLVFSILVYESKEGWRAVCLDRELANSLFVKLYFLRGWGLKHFKTHIDALDGDNYIGSYLIEW
jgi:hypothetical protein